MYVPIVYVVLGIPERHTDIYGHVCMGVVSDIGAPLMVPVVVVIGTALEEYAQIEGIQEAVAGTGGGEGAAVGPRRGHGEAASEA